MERGSVSLHLGCAPLWSILLISVSLCAVGGDKDEGEAKGEMQRPFTSQATTTQLWAVDWGPTQPLEDETHHFLPSLETESLRVTTSEDRTHHRSPLSNHTQQPTTAEEDRMERKEQDLEEVDPQFYVTVTISSLLILSAIIIAAKLCHDRSLPQRRPPLSLAIPRPLAPEDSRQTLRSTPSFPDRERIPVVNL